MNRQYLMNQLSRDAHLGERVWVRLNLGERKVWAEITRITSHDWTGNDAFVIEATPIPIIDIALGRIPHDHGASYIPVEKPLPGRESNYLPPSREIIYLPGDGPGAPGPVEGPEDQERDMDFGIQEIRNPDPDLHLQEPSEIIDRILQDDLYRKQEWFRNNAWHGDWFTNESHPYPAEDPAESHFGDIGIIAPEEPQCNGANDGSCPKHPRIIMNEEGESENYPEAE
jgi:hypothetical protein